MEQAKGRQIVEVQSEVLVEVKVATTKSTWTAKSGASLAIDWRDVFEYSQQQ